MKTRNNGSINRLMEAASREALDPTIANYAEANGLTIVANPTEANEAEGKVTKDQALGQIKQAQEYVYGLFTGENFSGESVELPSLTMKEALNSSDVSIVFPRVIGEILQEPTEPSLYLTNTIAEKVNFGLDGPNFVTFPTVSAMVAEDIPEGGEYPQNGIAFGEHITEMRIRKIGTACSLTEETIKGSMWPMVALHLRLMSRAIDRKLEENLYQTMVRTANTVFDNEETNTAFHTSGKGSDGKTKNATFGYLDYIAMHSVMLGNKYEGTHFLAHPLAWPVFATDPVMRSQFFYGGNLGVNQQRKPEFDQQAMTPFGIQYVPYYNINFKDNDTLTGYASGAGACLTTEFYLLDKANSLYLMQNGGTQMDQMENWFKDSTSMKAKRFVGMSAKDLGKGMLVAKNIRVAQNHEVIFNVGMVSL